MSTPGHKRSVDPFWRHEDEPKRKRFRPDASEAEQQSTQQNATGPDETINNASTESTTGNGDGPTDSSTMVADYKQQWHRHIAEVVLQDLVCKPVEEILARLSIVEDLAHSDPRAIITPDVLVIRSLMQLIVDPNAPQKVQGASKRIIQELITPLTSWLQQDRPFVLLAAITLISEHQEFRRRFVGEVLEIIVVDSRDHNLAFPTVSALCQDHDPADFASVKLVFPFLLDLLGTDDDTKAREITSQLFPTLSYVLTQPQPDAQLQVQVLKIIESIATRDPDLRRRLVAQGFLHQLVAADSNNRRLALLAVSALCQDHDPADFASVKLVFPFLFGLLKTDATQETKKVARETLSHIIPTLKYHVNRQNQKPDSQVTAINLECLQVLQDLLGESQND